MQPEGEFGSPQYVILMKLTAKAASDGVAASVQTILELGSEAAALGITLEKTVLTLGRYDLVQVASAPADPLVMYYAKELAETGLVSTETLRGSTEADFFKDMRADVAGMRGNTRP